ncbi:MAG: T9SS type A sorting domain-containing protein [Flavobacteriales bacterium]|nr:T9SS type A sorting domain-containing protein [Flavobacteriales bacterium]
MNKIITSIILLIATSTFAQVNLLPTIGIGSLPADSDPIATIPNVPGSSSNIFAGDTIPHFNLYDISGVAMDIQTTLQQGKAVLIMCGSYTCPAFRNKVDELNDTAAMYPAQIEPMIIYVVEAHPQGPDVSPYSGLVNEANNASIGALFPQPTTYGERKVIVQAFIDSMSSVINGVPIYIDGVNNEWWHAFGEAPNDGFLIDPSGIVAIEHVWFDKVPDDMFADVAVYIAANPTLGTQEFFKESVKIFPNPVSIGAPMQFYIPDGIESFTISITDITGKQVLATSKSEVVIETNLFNSGIYVWNLITDSGERTTGKLIVQ